jgi:hypothetical protein
MGCGTVGKFTSVEEGEAAAGDGSTFAPVVVVAGVVAVPTSVAAAWVPVELPEDVVSVRTVEDVAASSVTGSVDGVGAGVVGVVVVVVVVGLGLGAGVDVGVGVDVGDRFGGEDGVGVAAWPVSAVAIHCRGTKNSSIGAASACAACQS